MARLAWNRAGLNRSPHAPYNGRMLSRPQFSLRVLLFVTAMVCLAAATLHRAPPKDWYGGDQQWGELGFAVHVQAWLRLAACVVFPAALIAAAAARGGYSRAFCLGALLPAGVPLLLVLYGTAGILEFTNVFRGYAVLSHMLSERIGALWLCAPCVGFVCVVIRWFLSMSRQGDAYSRRRFIVRASFMSLVALCASWAIVALPSSATPTGNQRMFMRDTGPSVHGVFTLAVVKVTPPGVWRQIPLRMLLCLVLPAVLGVGAVEGRGIVRAFWASGLLPALVPATLVSGVDLVTHPIDGRWEPAAMFEWRYSIFA
ncbi:MAG: hypothetical protein ACREHD_13165, partial [Pirellulales bacterium]